MKLKTGMRSQNNGLLDLIAILPRDIIMTEVGCYAGESTLLFMQSDKVKVLHAIDPWSKTWEGDVAPSKIEKYQYVYANMEWAEQSFDYRLKGYGVVKHKGVFADFIEILPPMDFIYIDGDHRYDYVKEDILNALKIIKKGGIVAGHDYEKVHNPEVIKAVDEVFGKPDRVFRDTSWLKYIH